MTSELRGAALAALIVLPLAACQGSGMTAAPADPATAMLAGSCANCHGTDGRSPAQMPTIAGAPVAVLKAQLEAFKAGTAPNATVMTRIAKGYSDAELAALAQHFSQMKR